MAQAAPPLLSFRHGMCRFLEKGGDPVSSRYLRIVAVIAFTFTSGAALACNAGAKMKSADGSQGSAPTSSSPQRGG